VAILSYVKNTGAERRRSRRQFCLHRGQGHLRRRALRIHRSVSSRLRSWWRTKAFLKQLRRNMSRDQMECFDHGRRDQHPAWLFAPLGIGLDSKGGAFVAQRSHESLALVRSSVMPLPVTTTLGPSGPSVVVTGRTSAGTTSHKAHQCRTWSDTGCSATDRADSRGAVRLEC
jgi:hypothetical protein